ncbi:MAG: hypothetical protein SLAVMIC_00138 [uncultured marine phage]|uniref:Uncharacterized protein n=1 Tax=uncultured marine phage TaxID=707152 RepID=A0A8D9C8E8_9VIRU|nr:MAG: hypothetical protein SLAVMIC_00138 [uncultured marine phage]
MTDKEIKSYIEHNYVNDGEYVVSFSYYRTTTYKYGLSYNLSYSIHTIDNKRGRSRIERIVDSKILENFKNLYREQRLKELLD